MRTAPPLRPFRVSAGVCLALLLAAGCATLPPGSGQPKPPSRAPEPSVDNTLGKSFVPLGQAHGGDSGFRLLSAGIDGLTARVEMIDSAQRSIDIQTYIFRADVSGNVIVRALLRAAERGVRVRILTDDGETVPGDERILSLSAKPGIEVRIFNPLRYRGHHEAFRNVDFLFEAGRLDYRMHNKLMVADNAVAIIGGRNIGDQYFQIDPESQFGDDDIVVAGPIVPRLSDIYDQFWNSDQAIPAPAVDKRHSSAKALSDYLAMLAREGDAAGAKHPDSAPNPKSAPGADRQPFLDIVSGRSPLIWSPMKLVYDSPDKKDVDKGHAPGRLIYTALSEEVGEVRSELLVVTPYFIPSPDELRLIKEERERNARVRIMTNSLAAAPNNKAHSGYMHYRVGLLQEGVDLYEVRALLGNASGSGQSKAISRHGNYGLHAKLFVFDRRVAFVGSMNFDERSKHLNTEIGLLISSPELSREIAARFDSLARLDDSYTVTLVDEAGKPRLVWKTREDGKLVEYRKEPARSEWQRLKVKFLSALPLDKEL
ncbi:MAG TPA: phospholipase D family protein [Steroidobacteraceae bacterium]|nr:phospholipase D family protein [Steroidobacteraceae bacterium]